MREAFSQGKTVVGTSLGGTPEMIVDGETGKGIAGARVYLDFIEERKIPGGIAGSGTAVGVAKGKADHQQNCKKGQENSQHKSFTPHLRRFEARVESIRVNTKSVLSCPSAVSTVANTPYPYRSSANSQLICSGNIRRPPPD